VVSKQRLIVWRPGSAAHRFTSFALHRVSGTHRPVSAAYGVGQVWSEIFIPGNFSRVVHQRDLDSLSIRIEVLL
jgi:hypothetical protein